MRSRSSAERRSASALSSVRLSSFAASPKALRSAGGTSRIPLRSFPTAPSLPSTSRSMRASSGASRAAPMASSACSRIGASSVRARSALTGSSGGGRGRGARRARDLDQLVEGRRVVDSELGELLPVQLDAALLQAIDEGRVGRAARPHRGADARDPERAILALLRAPVARAVGPGAHDRLVHRAPQARAAAPEPLGALEVALLLATAGSPEGDAYHGLGSHHLLDQARPHALEHQRPAERAPRLAGVGGVHVAAPGLRTQHLPVLA